MEKDSDQITQPSVTDTPTVTNTPAEVPALNKPSGKKSGKMLMLLVGVILIALAALGGYKVSSQSADKKTAELNSKIALLESNEHDLPAGAVKISDCIPNMGAHYITKTSDAEYGPFILVNKQDKVIGVEYMASKDMYTLIPNTEPIVELITKDSPTYGWKYDHAEVSHLPKGHEGLLVDHIDIHLYTVTAEQQKNACI